MRWIQTGAVAAVLFAGRVLADDAQQTALKTMHEAMTEQAGMPATAPVMPDHSAMDPASMQKHTAMQQKADAQQNAQMQHNQEMHQKHAEQVAHQHAVMHGTKDADAVRVEVANKTAMGAAMGGAASAMQQGSSDCQNAAGMMRTTNPAGMMGGSDGSGGMMGGSTDGTTTNSGTTGTGTMGTGTTTATGSMLTSGGK